MKYYQLCFLCSLLFLCCCQRSTRNSEITNIDKAIKMTSRTTKIDTVCNFVNDELIYARRFFVYNDSILIVQNNKYSDVFFVEFYKLSDLKPIAKFFRLGNGPNELLSGNVTIQGSLLTVNDFIKKQVAFLNIDSVLNNSNYVPITYSHYCNTPTAVSYKDSLLLLENPHCFDSKDLNINNKAPRFVTTLKGKPYIEDKEYEYFTRNVCTDGSIITHSKYDRILYADFNNTILEVYDYDLNLIRKITGPDKLPIQYTIHDGGVSFMERIPCAYLNYCCSERFVYVTYFGVMYSSKHSLEEFPAYLFKFDWDGNLIETYSVGRYINTISLSLDGRSIYATALNNDNNPFLIKIHLDED